MADSQKPNSKLGKKVLPKALWSALNFIYAQNISGCVLAGGTALAGFYAGHRRSDDLDFFTADESHQRSAVLAVRALESIGVDIRIENQTTQYFEGVGKLNGDLFKITVVQDTNLFRVGKSIRLEDNIEIVTLETLFKMKAATLVSRCSEKDLYDLIWIFGKFPQHTFADLVAMGSEIDGGVNGEVILSSVAGAILRKEACDFALEKKITAEYIFREIKEFRKGIIKGIAEYLESEPVLPLGALVKKLTRLSK